MCFHWQWIILKKLISITKTCTWRLHEHHEHALTFSPCCILLYVSAVQSHSITASSHIHVAESTMSKSKLQSEETRFGMQSFSTVVCDTPSLHPAGGEKTVVCSWKFIGLTQCRTDFTDLWSHLGKENTYTWTLGNLNCLGAKWEAKMLE